MQAQLDDLDAAVSALSATVAQQNDTIAEQTNTILKMAQKRALVAAVLIATNASDYFTQDLDDFVTGEIIDGSIKHEAPKSGNPDPIDDVAWQKWEALCARADKVRVPHANPNRETTLKADLRSAYKELEPFVKDAEDQAQATE